MKKTIGAALLLALLLALAIFNTHCIEKLTDELTALIEQSRSDMRNGDFDKALDGVNQAYERWMSSDGFTHTVIQHSTITDTTDSFCQLIGDLNAAEEGAAEGSYEKLLTRIRSIVETEKITLKSIM